MLSKENITEIENYFDDKVIDSFLLKTSNSSNVFLIKTRDKNYILKQGVTNQSLKKEFDNHRTIYDIWRKTKNVIFYVPAVYFFDKESNFYVLEFIENSSNLQDLISKGDFETLEKIFLKVGEALSNYHEMTTSALVNKQASLFEHNTVKSAVQHSNKFKKLYTCLPQDSYRIIFKDFKATNVLVSSKDEIYFIDFQNICYFAPFYYDLARFIDTTKIFTFLKSPMDYFLNRGRINKLLDIFAGGYSKNFSARFLSVARKLHQMEHIYMKRDKRQFFNAFILKILYKLKI